ncbi:MAG: type II toxin-antitoxin system VapC family toxin [Planctomycetota bacterium]
MQVITWDLRAPGTPPAVWRYPHTLLVDRMWALRRKLTAYDAAYIALAEALNAPLLTCDRRLARAPGHKAVVEVM